MSELSFESVTVHYGPRRRGTTAVQELSLAVPSGTVVGLVGESGSGKSSLARAAVGLIPLSGGRILLDGRPLGPLGKSRPLQMVFQDPYSSLDPRMTIGASIAEALPRPPSALILREWWGRHAQKPQKANHSTKINGREIDEEVGQLLELVDLPAEYVARYPAQLSGGQRQRVALARALGGRPAVLIADEITSALDVSIQGTVLNLVRRLQQAMHLTMLFISHDLAVVRYVSDIIAVMHDGRIVESGPAADLLSDPQHPYTRQLLAAAPRRNR